MHHRRLSARLGKTGTGTNSIEPNRCPGGKAYALRIRSLAQSEAYVAVQHSVGFLPFELTTISAVDMHSAVSRHAPASRIQGGESESGAQSKLERVPEEQEDMDRHLVRGYQCIEDRKVPLCVSQSQKNNTD